MDRQSIAVGMPHTKPAERAAHGPAYRWAQLGMGIVCMALIANLQYAWTLFVSPMEAKNHWGLTAIQLSFSIFVVVETWLVPVEGWLVDKFGPRPVIGGGAVLAALGWVVNSYATSLGRCCMLARCIAGLGAGVRVRHLRRQCAEVVPGQARPGCRADRSGLRRRRGGDRDSDREHDPVLRLRAYLPVLRHHAGGVHLPALAVHGQAGGAPRGW